jgi:histidyl-tRNA synthetase
VQAGEGTPDYFLVYTDERSKEEALRTLFQLRRSFRVDIDYTGRSLKGQFRQAHRLGARRVLIFGPDELRRGCVRMRDMAGGKEEEIRLDDLTDALEEDGVS